MSRQVRCWLRREVWRAWRHRLTDPAPLAVRALPDGFAAIEIHPASQRVFVSSPSASVVTATGFGGEILGTISVPGAGALLVDGDRRYVASTTGGRVDVFDATTLAPSGTYGGGSLVKSNTLAMAGDRLWTTTGSCGSTVRLVSIATATGAMTTHGTLSGLTYCPFLHHSPTDPTMLIGCSRGSAGEPRAPRRGGGQPGSWPSCPPAAAAARGTPRCCPTGRRWR